MKVNSSKNDVNIQIISILYIFFTILIIISSFLPYSSYMSFPSYQILIFGGWTGVIFSIISIISLQVFRVKDGVLTALYGNILLGFNLVLTLGDGFGFFVAIGSWIALCILNYALFRNQEKNDAKEIISMFLDSKMKIGLSLIKALYIIFPIAIILSAYLIPSYWTFGDFVQEVTVGSYIFLLFGGWLGYASLLISFSNITPGKIRNAIRTGLSGNVIIGINILFLMLNSGNLGDYYYHGLGINLCLVFWLLLCVLTGLLFVYLKEDLLKEKKLEVSRFQSDEDIIKLRTQNEETTSSLYSNLEKKKGLTAFISYAMKDTELFNVRLIAESLTNQEEIDAVLYCEKDTRDNFVKYMNEYVGKCDVMFLFCSPNALKSRFVEDEWMAAHAMEKPIIPVFIKTEHIPPILRARIGVEFDTFDVQKNIDQLYSLTLKKTHKV